MSEQNARDRADVTDPIIPLIEAGRLRLIQRDGLVRDASGTAGPYDDQPISKAVRGSKGKANCLLLYRAARDHGAGGIVELGTNLGISSAYLAAGARHHKAGVVTGDCSGKRLGIARSLHMDCGLDNVDYVEGFFKDTAETIFGMMPGWTLAFIDGDHTLDGTMRYYDLALQTGRSGCVVIFDDIEWSEGMKSAWAEIKRLRPADWHETGDMGFVAL